MYALIDLNALINIDIMYIQNNTVSVDTINSNVLIKNGFRTMVIKKFNQLKLAQKKNASRH